MKNIKTLRWLVPVFALVVSIVTPLVPVAYAANLAGETFNGISTTANAWTSGGGGGSVTCLTAATTSAANSIPACPGGPLDTVGNGLLRLTPATNGVAGFAIYNTPISAGDGLDIQFDMYQYGGTNADGISFFLIDGATSPMQPGAYGGSLGYASGGATPGIVGGYVGVGFDRFGNYSNSNVGGGGPGPQANSVGLRGSEAQGFPFITMSPANGSLSATTRAASLRHVKINVSTDNIMSVAVDYGSGYETELSGIDLNTVNGAGTMPANFKFGFAASTGGSNNNHAIGGLVVKTNPPSVSVNMASSGPYVQGGTANFTLSAKNAASAEVTSDTITITQTLPSGITPTTAAGTGWNCAIAGQVVTCSRPGDGANALAPGATTPNITVSANIASNASTPKAVTALAATNGNDPLAATSKTTNLTIQTGSYLDDDGIFNTVEAAAPNSGDGNDDGTDDSEQDDVTSLPNPVSGKYSVLETNGCSATNSNVSVAAESENAAADGNYLYPAGLMNFHIGCATPGGTATVTQYFYGTYDASKIVARKYNTTTHTYQTIPNATITNVTIGGEAAIKIQYAITDGGALDEDGLSNGVIVDPSGPAVLATTVGSPAVAGAPNTGLPQQSMLVYYLAGIVGSGLIGYEIIRRRQNRKATTSTQ